MNIFYLSNNPLECARWHIDAHIKGGKMLVETCQMLANAYSLERLAAPDCPRTQKGTPRKHSYLHHPCSKWALQNESHWEWLLRLATYLSWEYTHRSGKVHFCDGFVQWCDVVEPSVPEWKEFIEPPQCMPDCYKQSSTIQAYRAMYMGDKIPRLGGSWTGREIPYWALTQADSGV